MDEIIFFITPLSIFVIGKCSNPKFLWMQTRFFFWVHLLFFWTQGQKFNEWKLFILDCELCNDRRRYTGHRVSQLSFFLKNESYQLKKKKILKGSYLVLKGSYYYTSITITKISNAKDSHVVNAEFFFLILNGNIGSSTCIWGWS